MPNGSFEEKSYCPVTFNQTQLTIVKAWSQPTGATPDYFHACSKKAGVPKNLFGSQEAYEGAAYLGIVTFTPSQRNYREYVQVKLKRALAKGELVCVEYQVSPSDGARYVTDGFGGYFSRGPLKSGNQKRLPVTAHVGNPTLHIVDSYDHWIKISDTYTAQGGETHLTFGNFRDDRDLNILRREDPQVSIESEWSYLYLDDVVVKTVKTREACSCANDIITAGVSDPPLQLEEVRQLSFGAIRFSFDAANLSDSARSELNTVARILHRSDAFFLRITGHTDVVGSDGYNSGLSQRRADAVMAYLTDKGIDPSRMTLEWKGSGEPTAENSTAEGRALNRRVEFEVMLKRYSDASVPR